MIVMEFVSDDHIMASTIETKCISNKFIEPYRFDENEYERFVLNNNKLRDFLRILYKYNVDSASFVYDKNEDAVNLCVTNDMVRNKASFDLKVQVILSSLESGDKTHSFEKVSFNVKKLYDLLSLKEFKESYTIYLKTKFPIVINCDKQYAVLAPMEI